MRHPARVTDLWIISRSRSTKLSDSETVRLGRSLIDASAKSHVWYPDAPMATAVIADYTGSLSTKALARVTDVLGEVDMEART